MTKVQVPYGSWQSPITAADVARAGIRVAYPSVVGDEAWWLEGRPAEEGRVVVVAADAAGDVRDVLPAGWSARTRVHEYGGLCYVGWVTDAGAALAFCEWADQRVYRLLPGDDAPVPLTPAPSDDVADRFADLVLDLDGARLLAVRERHSAGGITRSIVAIPLDGTGALAPDAVSELASGGDFLANPRLSPDRRRLAWLRWSHPAMPWDETELLVAALDEDGRAGDAAVVLGGQGESVTQAEWVDDATLRATSDRTGWWNLYDVDGTVQGTVQGTEPRPLHPAAEEFGGPLWQLGARTFAALPDGRVLTLHGAGGVRPGVLDPATGTLVDVPTDLPTWGPFIATDGRSVVGVAASPTSAAAVVRVDLASGSTTVLRSTMPDAPPAELLPDPRAETFTGRAGRQVHAHVYPPRNPGFTAPDGERPPYVVFAHGGPTGFSPMILNLEVAYFTSRGIGVIDVNYGGSAAYGRAYREQLRHQWGYVDVEDCADAALALAARGDADGTRLGIRGGSAGGWTVLAAVTSTDDFACGVSYYGVADLLPFVETTHDFESRYIFGLVGDPADDPDVLVDRSPVTHADRVQVPVLLLQGSDDPVVPPAQSEVFRDALAAKGIAHAYVVFEGEQHGFRRAQSMIDALEAELSFYGQVMGFEPPGVPRLGLAGELPNGTR